MYNRYVPRGNGHVRIQMEDARLEEGQKHSSHEQKYTSPASGTQGKEWEQEEKSACRGLGGQDAAHSGDKSGGLRRMLKALKLEAVDGGDLLLFLILLLLLTDGDDLDLLIVLGLIAVLGMGEKKSPNSGGLSGLLGFL